MLLDEKMLPSIKTRIPQMQDLLQTEQAYLDVILEFVDWLQGRMILLGEAVMNIPNLKEKIRQITGWNCEIIEDAENLTVTIRYYYDAQEPILEQQAEILKYVPAHLKVIHEFLQKYTGTQRVFTGTGAGIYVKYTCMPQETNGVRSGKAEVGIQGNVYIHTKMIAYPEGR